MTMFNQYPTNMKGFTLIELIMVIVLIGALTSVASVFIVGPVQGFVDSSRRAELVDIAETALQRMTREIHYALPNSVRVSDNGAQFALEYLNTTTGGRYRASGSGRLKFNKESATFNALGKPPGAGSIDTAGGTGQAACLNNTVDCLVIYNTGTGATDFNAYAGNNIAAITAVTDDGAGNILTMTFDKAPMGPFPAASPNRRFFVVDGPVSFVCDSSSGELLMYQGYNITSGQPLTAAAFGVAGAVLADKVSDCGTNTFLYDTGAGMRYGLVVIRLTVTEAGESVSLLQQSHVLNAP